MNIKKMIQKIVDDGDRHEMEELSDILEDVTKMVRDYDEKEGKKIEMQLYEMAYGKRLTDDMKREWVEQMRPSARWTEEEAMQIASDYGIEMPYLSFYVLINKMYSDERKAFEDDDEQSTLRRYIDGANGWYYDSDTTNTEEAKLFCYWMYIVN